jgi:hypothetical protein
LIPERGHAHFAAAGAKPLQQTQCGIDPIGRRHFEPLKRSRIGAPREQVEYWTGKIDPRDLWLAMRAKSRTGIPESSNDAGPEPRRTACALVRRIHRDAFEREPVDATLCVVTRDFHQPCIDNSGDARNRQ